MIQFKGFMTVKSVLRFSDLRRLPLRRCDPISVQKQKTIEDEVQPPVFVDGTQKRDGSTIPGDDENVGPT